MLSFFVLPIEPIVSKHHFSVSSGSQLGVILSPGVLGNVWRHFGLSHCGVGNATVTEWVEARVAIKCSRMHGADPIAKNYPAQSDNSAKTERPWSGV